MAPSVMICRSCGHVGKPKHRVQGSIAIEFLLWCLLIVPGLIYSAWRHTSKQRTCAMCASTGMIPVNTPVGMQMLNHHRQQLAAAAGGERDVPPPIAGPGPGVASAPRFGSGPGVVPPASFGPGPTIVPAPSSLPPMRGRPPGLPGGGTSAGVATSVGSVLRAIVLWIIGVCFVIQGVVAVSLGQFGQALLVVIAGYLTTPPGWRLLCSKAPFFDRSGNGFRAGIPAALFISSIVVAGFEVTDPGPYRAAAVTPTGTNRTSETSAGTVTASGTPTLSSQLPKSPAVSSRTSAASAGSAGSAASVPSDLDYRILDQNSVPGVKQSLDVELSRRATETELEALAKVLAKNRASFQRTFILYYLPGQDRDGGAWATSHFNPDLNVRIMGFQQGQEAETVAASKAAIESGATVIGSWQRELPPGVITISTVEGRTYLSQVYADGSGSRHLLRRHPWDSGTRFDDVESRHEEFYVVTENGRLEIWDPVGRIETLRSR